MDWHRKYFPLVNSLYLWPLCRTVTIPAYIPNNTWTQLAIRWTWYIQTTSQRAFPSIEGGRTIKTFINCSWVTTQIIDGHSFHVHKQPDLVIGYMMQVARKQSPKSDSCERMVLMMFDWSEDRSLILLYLFLEPERYYLPFWSNPNPPGIIHISGS